MMPNWLWHIPTVSLVCNLLLTSVFGQMCVYQVCSCDREVIYCSNLRLTEVPPLTGQDYPFLVQLYFDNNNITTIPSGSLPSGLMGISFIDNPIQSIAVDAFNESINTLQSLTITLDQHAKIPDALIQLKSLTSLGIYDSGVITDWNVAVMKHLGPNLDLFTLKNVSLTEWPDWIQYFIHVTQLTIDSASLVAIPDNALDSVASILTTLILSNNSLLAVPRALSNLTVLERLYLDYNHISDTSWLPNAKALMSLSLNNNNIFNTSQLSLSLRPYKDSLSELDLQHNHLSSIPELDFLNIGSLDFSNNEISDLMSGSLPAGLYELNLGNNLLTSLPVVIRKLESLRGLTISWNSISAIQGSQFSPSVQLLEMGHNLLTEITETSFPNSSKMNNLYLSYNPITAVSKLAFDNLPSLVELNLSHTKLTRLPLGLSSLKILYRLDMSGAVGLVCTCVEKTLAALIVSMDADNVIGTCGNTNIYEFFKIFSATCP